MYRLTEVRSDDLLKFGGDSRLSDPQGRDELLHHDARAIKRKRRFR